MWWLSALVLVAAPVSPGATAIRFVDALARADVAADISGAAQSARHRTEGLGQLGHFTSNPQVQFQPGARSEAGVFGPEGQVTVTQSLNLGGLSGARRAVAEEESTEATLEARRLRQARRIAVAHAWLEAWAAQAASTSAHDEEAAAKELLQRLERAAVSGGTTRVEVATARAFAAEAAALHLEWEGRRVDAGAQLAFLLGLDTLAVAEGPLPVLPTLAHESAREAGSRLAADVVAAQVRAEERRADEVKAQWSTQLQVSVQGGHEAPSQWFGNVGLGVTLPVLETGQRERTAHEAVARRLKGELSLEQRRAQVTLALVRHELEHTAETLEVVKNQQLPAAEEAAALEAKRFATGEATLFELTVLKRQALASRIAAVLAEARFVAARAHAAELENSP